MVNLLRFATENINIYKMKKGVFLMFMVAVGLTFSACSKGSETVVSEQAVLTAEFLKQSAWKGTLTKSYNDDEFISESPVSVFFATDTRGEYEYSDLESGKKYKGDFTYSIDDKLINFVEESFPNQLDGDWLATKITIDELELVKDIYSDSRQYLSLKRTH